LTQLRRRLSYANVTATIAVFLALGGGAYAAFKLPRNSVGTQQLRKNAVTSSKVKNHSLLASDFRLGQLPAGPRGPQGIPGHDGTNGQDGAPGQPGAPGTALAFGYVFTDGSGVATVDASHAKDLSTANVVHPTSAPTGVYCFGKLDFTPKNVQVTRGLFGGTVAAQIPASSSCTAPYNQFEVVTDDATSGTVSNTPTFYVLIN
jgi:hypothetical protein